MSSLDLRYKMLCKKEDSGRLPKGYQEVEYIESTGTQYIDTCYVNTSNTKPSTIELQIQLAEIVHNRRFVGSMGNKNQGTPNYIGTLSDYNGTSSSPKLWTLGHHGNSSGGLAQRSSTVADLNKHIIRFTFGDGLYLDGTAIIKGGQANTTSNTKYSHYLFAVNNGGGGAECKTRMKLFYCKFYETNTLVRDFVPCYRKSDGEIGLYDLVNDVFYTNQGTGTFIKGNDIK